MKACSSTTRTGLSGLERLFALGAVLYFAQQDSGHIAVFRAPFARAWDNDDNRSLELLRDEVEPSEMSRDRILLEVAEFIRWALTRVRKPGNDV